MAASANLATLLPAPERCAPVAADLTTQVDSFWQELFDGTSYSPDFLSSLSNLTDLQQKLSIPQTGIACVGSFCSPALSFLLAQLRVVHSLIINFAADVNFIQTLLPGNAASEVSETVNSALLSGLQLAAQLESEFCTPPHIQKGINYPTECEVNTTP